MEVGNVGSDQLLHGGDVGDVEAITSETPVVPGPRPSVLADDEPRLSDQADGPVAIRFDSSEVPFQQPDRRTAPSEPVGRDWRAVAVDVGRWPLIALLAAAVLVAVFVAFISRNGQSPSADGGAVEPQGAFASAVVSDSRSTGTVRSGGGSAFHSGVVVEPESALTGSDVDWTPTTAAQTEESTTVGPSSTVASTTTTPETTVTSPSTTAPTGPWVRAVAPGSPDEQNPASVGGDRLTLEAEGSSDNMRYRFFVHVKDGRGEWRLVERSRWRSRSTWTINVGRYDGQTIRWSVVGSSGSRNVTEESTPLYLRVGDGDGGGGGDDDSDDDVGAPVPEVGFSNGDFEQGVGGFDTFRNYGNGAIAGWTSSTGEFEVWASGFEGVSAASGAFFIELNAGSPSTITQRVDVAPGMELRWSFRHRSRTGGSETVDVVVGSGADPIRLSASGGRWVRHEGSYVVPAGVDRIDFSIRAVTGGSVGNFIDDTRIQAVG